MVDEVRLRVAQEPVGGDRIAWSYLAAVVGVAVGALAWAVWSPFGTTVCGDAADAACQLGWVVSGGLVGVTLGLGLAAFVFRLGWEWWAVLAALLLGSPLWLDAVPGWAPAVVGLAAPALAAAATWAGPRRPAWRPWLLGAAAFLLVAGGVASILL